MPQQPCKICAIIFKMPWSGVIILLSGLGALFTAFTAQYLFGVQACDLCYLERVPYVLVAVLALMAIMSRPYGRVSRILLGFCSLTFLVSMGQAIFHAGVEQHWWDQLAGCAVLPLKSGNLIDLREQLLATSNVPCDQITWTFLGVSMVIWNIFFSLAMTIFAAMAARSAGNPDGPGRCCLCKLR